MTSVFFQKGDGNTDAAGTGRIGSVCVFLQNVKNTDVDVCVSVHENTDAAESGVSEN